MKDRHRGTLGGSLIEMMSYSCTVGLVPAEGLG